MSSLGTSRVKPGYYDVLSALTLHLELHKRKGSALFLGPQHLEQCLAHSRCSSDVCRIKKCHMRSLRRPDELEPCLTSEGSIVGSWVNRRNWPVHPQGRVGGPGELAWKSPEQTRKQQAKAASWSLKVYVTRSLSGYHP